MMQGAGQTGGAKEEDVCVLNLCDDGLVEDVRTDHETAEHKHKNVRSIKT